VLANGVVAPYRSPPSRRVMTQSQAIYHGVGDHSNTLGTEPRRYKHDVPDLRDMMVVGFRG
jgi:hypothetical protein